MKTLSLFAAAALALTVGIADFVSPAYAGSRDGFKTCKVSPHKKHCVPQFEDTDTDTDSTKNLNGRTGQAAALGAALDSRIANPGERINLDLNRMTNDIGGAGAVGGSAFFHVPELDDNLYVGLRGGFGFEGQGTLVGVGASWAFSPF